MIAMLFLGTMMDGAAQSRAEKTSSAKAYYGTKPGKPKISTPKKQKQRLRPNKKKGNSSGREVRKRFATTIMSADAMC